MTISVGGLPYETNQARWDIWVLLILRALAYLLVPLVLEQFRMAHRSVTWRQAIGDDGVYKKILTNTVKSLIIVDENGVLRHWYAHSRFRGYGYVPWRTAL